MKKLLIIIALFGFTPFTFAQYREYRMERYPRENYERRDEIQFLQRQIRRDIAFGIESGKITSRESRQLLREVEKNEQLESRYKRDGRLDAREKRELMEDLEMLSRLVRREKRDDDRVSYEEHNRGHGRMHHERSRDRY